MLALPDGLFWFLPLIYSLPTGRDRCFRDWNRHKILVGGSQQLSASGGQLSSRLPRDCTLRGGPVKMGTRFCPVLRNFSNHVKFPFDEEHRSDASDDAGV